MFAPVVDGLVWQGRVVCVLTEDLVVASADAPFDLGQILTSHHAVYHDIAEFIDSVEVTIQPSASTVVTLSAIGYENLVLPLVSQRATARLELTA